jgi:hypothetical protein
MPLAGCVRNHAELSFPGAVAIPSIITAFTFWRSKITSVLHDGSFESIPLTIDRRFGSAGKWDQWVGKSSASGNRVN